MKVNCLQQDVLVLHPVLGGLQGTGNFKALPAVTNSGRCNAMTLGNLNHDGKLSVVTVGFLPGQYNASGQFFPGETSVYNPFINAGG